MTETSNPFAVKPGALGSFTIANIASPQTAGTAFNVNATAFDTFGNMKNDYNGSATVTSSLSQRPRNPH